MIANQEYDPKVTNFRGILSVIIRDFWSIKSDLTHWQMYTQ